MTEDANRSSFSLDEQEDVASMLHDAEVASADSEENAPSELPELYDISGLDEELEPVATVEAEDPAEEPVEAVEEAAAEEVQPEPEAEVAPVEPEEPFVPNPDWDEALASLLTLPMLGEPIWMQVERDLGISLENPSGYQFGRAAHRA